MLRMLNTANNAVICVEAYSSRNLTFRRKLLFPILPTTLESQFRFTEPRNWHHMNSLPSLRSPISLNPYLLIAESILSIIKVSEEDRVPYMWQKDTEWAHSHLMYWTISTISLSESCSALLLWILFESLQFEMRQDLQNDITCSSENF